MATEQLELFTFEETIRKELESEVVFNVDFNIPSLNMPRGLKYSLEYVPGWVRGKYLTWGNGRKAKTVFSEEVIVFVDPETLADAIYFRSINEVYGFGPYIWESQTRYKKLIFHFVDVADYPRVDKMLRANWNKERERKDERLYVE